eukprot:s2285_g4.t1
MFLWALRRKVHRAARRSFLGERAAATYEALHTAGHAQVEELSQRRWWALRGFLPAAEVSGMEQDDRGFQDLIQHHIPNRVAEEDQPEHMRPPNLRAVWHAHLEEVAREKAWRLNPCVLEHVTWFLDFPGKGLSHCGCRVESLILPMAPATFWSLNMVIQV